MRGVYVRYILNGNEGRLPYVGTSVNPQRRALEHVGKLSKQANSPVRIAMTTIMSEEMCLQLAKVSCVFFFAPLFMLF
jgi:hypothetical protein